MAATKQTKRTWGRFEKGVVTCLIILGIVAAVQMHLILGLIHAASYVPPVPDEAPASHR